MSGSLPLNRSKRSRILNRSIFFSLLLFQFITLPVALAADTSQQAASIINNMTLASKQLNYDGIFIYKRGPRMDTMRIIHKSGENGESERLISLTGIPREVIRNEDSITCIFPDNHAVMVNKSRPQNLLTTELLPEPIEKIAGFYTFSVAGKDRIAGRDTHVVNIVPRDKYRYGYQLWIDTDTYLLLKSELKDSYGKTMEQILFTQIDVMAEIPDHLLEPAINGKGYTWYNRTSEKTPRQDNYLDWKVTWMPEGFRMSDQEKQLDVTGKMPVVQMVYTDGLAVVSVFVEQLQKNPDVMRGASRMGAVNVYALLNNGHQVTAVGEVPQKTVQLMATSVKRQN